MKMSMERVIQTANFETMRMSVEMSDDDLIGFPFDDLAEEDRLHLACYVRILRFEVFHGHMTADDAKSEFIRARKFYSGDGFIDAR